MRWNRLASLMTIAAATVGGWSCSNDLTAPGGGTAPAATTLALVSGDAQIGAVGVRLAEPITVRVTDEHGAPVRGVSVTFQVTGGGGQVGTPAVPTNSEGLASTIWILGSGPTANTATARVSRLTGSPVTFTAAAVALLEKVNGDAQTAEVEVRAGEDPSVVVRDISGAPVPGVTVRWQVLAGGGRVDPTASVTNASGLASTAWTLGAVVGAGAHRLQASSSEQTKATFTASGTLTNGTISILSGDGQYGFTGWPVPVPPTVVVRTAGTGARVAGVAVNWTVTAGGGTVSAASVVTNSTGVASVAWTLGGTVGANAQGVSASVAGLPDSPVTFVASAASVPSAIVKLSGDLQTGTVAQTLGQLLVVEVRNSAGEPQPGVVVHWLAVDVCDGWCGLEGVAGSPSSDTTVTDDMGRASVGFVLPSIAGDFTIVEARVDGPVPIASFFRANLLPGPPVSMAWPYGNAQSAKAGSTLPAPIGVYVFDAFGNGIPGITVQWEAGPGSGSTQESSSVTDPYGAASTYWTIGTTIGTNNQVATATVAGIIGSPVTFTASATTGP